MIPFKTTRRDCYEVMSSFSCLVMLLIGVAGACDYEEIQLCSKTILPVISKISNEVIQSMNNADGEIDAPVVMAKICAAMKEFKECLKPAMENCPDRLMKDIQAKLDLLSKSPFYCANKGLPGSYQMTYSTCKTKQMEDCSRDVITEVNSLNQKLQAQIKNMDKPDTANFCRLVETFSECIKPVLHTCDQTEASFYITMLQQFTSKPYYCKIQLSESHPSRSFVPRASIMLTIIALLYSYTL